MRLFTLLLLLAPRLFGASLSADEFFKAVEKNRADGGAPSLVVAALSRGHAPQIAATGMADFGRKLSATAQTSYLWFSVTKLFVAVEVMRLVEAGKLRLETPVAEILPDFNYSNPYGVTITVAHLLSHTSGIPKPGMTANFSSIHLVSEPRPLAMDVLKRWSPIGATLVSEPGEEFAYNNAGYLWIGLIIEKVTGRPFTDVISDELLKPLGMTHSGFVHHDMSLAALGYGKAFSLIGFLGHVTANPKFHAKAVGAPCCLNAISHYYVDVPAASGLVGPVEDVVKFAAMILDGGVCPGGRILKKETIDSMFVPRRNKKGEALTAGLGFWVEKVGDEETGFHQGTGGGFRTEMRIFPASGYATVVASNLLSFDTHVAAKFRVSPDAR